MKPTIGNIFQLFRQNKLTDAEMCNLLGITQCELTNFRMLFRRKQTEVIYNVPRRTPPVIFSSKQESYYTEEEMLAHPFIGKGAMKEMLNQIKYL